MYRWGQVVQTDLDAGLIVNTASVTGFEPGGVPVTDLSNEVLVPAVLVRTIETVKTASMVSYSTPGEVLGYVITVRNTGNVTMSGVTVGDANADPGTVVCATTTVVPGGVVSCTAAHTVTQGDVDAGEVVNVAVGEAVPAVGPPVTDPSDQVIVGGVRSAGLGVLNMSTTVSYTSPGELIGYTFTVVNTGNVTVTGVVVSDANADPGTIICDTTTVVPGASVSCTAVHTVTQTDVDAGRVVNTVNVSGIDPAGAVVTAVSNEVIVAGTQTASLSIVLGSSTTSYTTPGELIGYTFTVVNTGKSWSPGSWCRTRSPIRARSSVTRRRSLRERACHAPGCIPSPKPMWMRVGW